MLDVAFGPAAGVLGTGSAVQVPPPTSIVIARRRGKPLDSFSSKQKR